MALLHSETNDSGIFKALGKAPIPKLIMDGTQLEKTKPDIKRKDTPGILITKKGKSLKLKKTLLSSLLQENEHRVFDGVISYSEVLL